MPNTLIETIAAGFSVAESDSPAAPAVRKVLQEFDYASLSPEEWRTVMAASFDAKARVAGHKKPALSLTDYFTA